MEQSDSSNRLRNNLNEFSEDSSSNNNLNSDRSLEKHLELLRIQNKALLNTNS